MRRESLADFGLPIELVEPHAPVVLFDKVTLAFDEKVILDGVTFDVRAGHTKIFLGASGAGKSTILKLMLGLLRPDAGTIWVLGHRVDEMNEEQLMRVRHHMGMVFQEGALFDSFSVGENVGYKRTRRPASPSRTCAVASKRCWGSSGSASTSTRPRRSCPAASAGASPSRGPWRPSRRSCCATSRPPAWTR